MNFMFAIKTERRPVVSLIDETVKNIKPLDEGAFKESRAKIDNLVKPIGSLGRLEEIVAKISGITGRLHNIIHKKNIIVMCADNGVVKEGVSACPQNLTAILADRATKGIMGVNVLADYAKSDVTIVDVGVNADFDNPDIINKKVARGTKNIVKGSAMTRDEAIKAIDAGIEMVDKLVKCGYDLLGVGELGIGNTTTSAAVFSVLSGMDSDMVVGKGAGLTGERYKNKKRIVKKSIGINGADKNDVVDVLAKLGGFDIAAMCGCFLGAARRRVPVVIDGFISSTAALCSCKLNSFSRDYMFASHLSAEPGSKYILDELGLSPILDLKMRLGEGSGCPLAFLIIEAALHTMNNMGSFKDAKIDDNFLTDIR